MKALLDYFPYAKRKTYKEYCSPCPSCGGRDRFILFIEQDRFFCRQCEIQGDVIDYLRLFENLSYKEALIELGIEKSDTFNYISPNYSKNVRVTIDYQCWQREAEHVFYKAKQNLVLPQAVDFLKTRGITKETALGNSLGWIPKVLFSFRNLWGLPKEGEKEKLFIPEGLLIATKQDENIVALKIRRVDSQQGEHYSKYHIIKGSQGVPYRIGMSTKYIFIVESELDVILLYQESKILSVEIKVIATGDKKSS